MEQLAEQQARMNLNPRISKDGQKRVGCLFVVMGSVCAAFGMAALLGVSNGIELEFFGIDLNSRSGRIWWVLGSLVTIGLGVLLFRANNRGA